MPPGRARRLPEIGAWLSIPHQMTRTSTAERGVEEWSCTQCSRRLLFRLPPAFEKLVLDHGDEQAAHVGGGLRAAAMARPADTASLPSAERRWLSEQGITWEPGETP